MKLNAIKFPSSVITDLYKKTLIGQAGAVTTLQKVMTTAAEKTIASKKEMIPFLGENKKKILLLVNYPGIPFLPDEELVFLTGILTACKLSLADTALVNLDKWPHASYKNLAAQFDSRVILLFGISPVALELPVDFPQFQVQSVNNCVFLYTPFPGEIRNDKLLKSKLWVCLKKIFSL